MSAPIVKFVWTGDRATIEAGASALTELLFPPASAVAVSRIDKPMEDGDDGEWKLEAYFQNDDDDQSIQGRLSALTPLWSAAGDGHEEPLPDLDWVAHSLEGLGVVRAGRFVLYGVHDAARLPGEDGDIAIRIDANQAFGTGHHPTTAGCLTLLTRLAGHPPRSILDLGCGSAVLAIAAAKLWDRDVLATDVDEKSVEIALENARLNAVGDRVAALVADGFDHPEIILAAPFDFVFANILAGPLIDLAAMMGALVTRGGRVMLAGLLAEQEDAVTAAYVDAGFRRINRLDQPEWPVLLFAKP